MVWPLELARALMGPVDTQQPWGSPHLMVVPAGVPSGTVDLRMVSYSST